MNMVAATPIYDKNPSEIFVQKQRPSDLVAWYIELGLDINPQGRGIICPCPGAIYMYKSIKIHTRTKCQVSYRTNGPVVLRSHKLVKI